MEERSSRRDRLRREIEFELGHLQRIADIAKQLSALPADERRPWDSAAAAKYVADLFLGLENLCKRRYRYLAIDFPTGPESHSRVLLDFLGDPALGGSLDEDMAERLKRYLRFRHRFAHGYGYDVSWEIVEEPLSLLPATIAALARVWRAWLESLSKDTSVGED